MMDRGLRLSLDGLPSPPSCNLYQARSASSKYPSPGNNTPRLQSPVSEYCRGNRLSFSGLSKFGRGNDCLSNIRSNTPSSNSQRAIGDTSNHDLMADAAAAITEWQDGSRPIKSSTYNNYSLADSSDLFPSDSLSQREDASLSPSSPPSPLFQPPRARRSAQHSEDPDNLDTQYDGAVDASRNISPEPKNGPTSAIDVSQSFYQSKRKASQFSLRSLTKSLSKRPRMIALRQWARNVYKGSSRRISEAYHRIKCQRHAHSADFGTQKPNVGRQQRADAPKVKSARPYGVFEYEKSGEGNQEWWKEGVTKYRAPSWMFHK